MPRNGKLIFYLALILKIQHKKDKILLHDYKQKMPTFISNQISKLNKLKALLKPIYPKLKLSVVFCRSK